MSVKYSCNNCECCVQLNGRGVVVMKKIFGIVITTLCLCLVTACGARDEKVNLEKTGKEYRTDQGVSFHYPSDFMINVKDSSTVEFSKNNDTLYFKVIKDDSDNVDEDKNELYIGELEEGGATSIEVLKPILDSGLSVYEYVFTYKDTGVKTMEIVYFNKSSTYIYGYRAAKEDFDINEKDMQVYLESFSKSTGK